MSRNLANDRIEGLGLRNLRQDVYQVTSEENRRYNCFAWAAGDVRRRWEPDLRGERFWPIAQREYTLECYVEAFKTLGYQPCSTGDFEEGYQKVVIYADRNLPAHMARQLESGRWTSKLGNWEDIRHETPEVVEGTAYGKVAQFLKRRRTEPDPEPPLPIS